jgi:hypothetical protein
MLDDLELASEAAAPLARLPAAGKSRAVREHGRGQHPAGALQPARTPDRPVPREARRQAPLAAAESIGTGSPTGRLTIELNDEARDMIAVALDPPPKEQ